MRMIKHGLKEYLVPDIEVLQIVVEKGFTGSSGQLPEYEEDDDVIVLG